MKLGAAAASIPPPGAWWPCRSPRRRTRQRADLHLATAQRQAAAGAPARRPLSAAHQPDAAAIRPSSGEYYIQLTQVEEAFKNLKGDLALRPIYHQNGDRIEAHIFVAFLAYCLHVTLAPAAARSGPGTDAAIGAGEVCRRADDRCASADDRWSARNPAPLHPTGEGTQVLLEQLKLELPAQPPPKITAAQAETAPPVVQTFGVVPISISNLASSQSRIR